MDNNNNPDEEESIYEFKSGWSYIVEKHLATIIIIAVVLGIAGWIYLSDKYSGDPPECTYTDRGCQGDNNRWGQ
ncbi:hypothetical protein [Cohnella nanjingensis]|uniref:Uncharacterized protein n=1 Tax=Cohnella nanjingensis TaxID=1387779 RepID=A0A7X0RS24_9BACL|nr:hypothetical protein [Cohnella nanjingensis]MBB6672633.1 hypothetical protein [Cohnella nanjingensis]